MWTQTKKSSLYIVMDNIFDADSNN